MILDAFLLDMEVVTIYTKTLRLAKSNLSQDTMNVPRHNEIDENLARHIIKE